MAMPDFIRPHKSPIEDSKSKNANIDSQMPKQTMKIGGIDTNSSYSINSDSFEEEKAGHKFQMNAQEQNKKHSQIEEESKNASPAILGHYSNMEMNQEKASIENGDVVEDNSQLESITPFQIKNQTPFKLIVIQDGIEEPKVGGVAV